MEEFALRLYDLGFNVVPVDLDKKPLCSWSSSKKIDRDTLVKLLDKATGVAVVGGFENPWKPVAVLVLIDVDNPLALEKSPTLKEAIAKTVSWRTGPRCPKCFNKHLDVVELGKKFRCSKCSLEFSIEEAERGFGALATVDLETYEKFFKGSLRFGDVEFLINNYQLIPPSIHSTGVEYEWVKQFDFNSPNLGVYPLTKSEVEAILNELKLSREVVEKKTEARAAGLRELSDSEVIKVKELLKNAYREGVRQYIWLYLSGWAAKAKISPISIAKTLKMLYEETGDTDSLKARTSAIVYSYKKIGVDVDAYAKEFEDVLGVKPYGLEKEVSEEQIKGKTGLQEVLEDVLGEEQALAVIKEIEDIFGAASPFRDSVFEILDYEKQLYAVANLRKLVVARARRSESGFKYRERVAIGAPVEVAVYVNPVGGVTKYQVRWETATRPKPIVVGPALLEEIVDRLKAEGLIVASRLAYDVLTAVVEGFIRKGRAVIKTDIDAQGFFVVDGKLVAANIDIEKPGAEDLRKALELLNELSEVWYAHARERFAAVVRWGIVAPFIFAYKQRGRWYRWLYLFGPSSTGKTTLASIALAVWGITLPNTRFEKTGASIDTIARLGHVLSQTTLPILVNEPGNALNKEDIVEAIKNAVENPTARGRFYRGSYVEIPALAPLIFTSNRYLPRDDALLRRFAVVSFSFGEKISGEKAGEFEEKVKPRLGVLKALGNFAASYILDKYSTSFGKDLDKLAVEVLEEAYRAVGMEIPRWIYLEHREEGDVYEDIRESVRSFLVNRITEAYTRFVGKVIAEYDTGVKVFDRASIVFENRVKVVLQENLIPWLILKDSDVYITSDILQELKGVVGDMSLRSLAELLGWMYEEFSIRTRGMVISRYMAKVSLKDFVEFLVPKIEEA